MYFVGPVWVFLTYLNWNFWYLKSRILFTAGTVISLCLSAFPSDVFLSPAKRDPAACLCQLPSSLASLLHFLHSTQKLSQKKCYHDPSLLESFCDSPGCMKSKLRTGYKACLGPRICSSSNLWACLHTCVYMHTLTHVVFKPYELLSFLKMPSFHILPYLSTFSSLSLVDIINTNPNFETLLKYLFLCKNGSFPP